MVLDRLGSDEELLRDLAVRAAGGGHFGDATFRRGQVLGAGEHQLPRAIAEPRQPRSLQITQLTSATPQPAYLKYKLADAIISGVAPQTAGMLLPAVQKVR